MKNMMKVWRFRRRPAVAPPCRNPKPFFFLNFFYPKSSSLSPLSISIKNFHKRGRVKARSKIYFSEIMNKESKKTERELPPFLDWVRICVLDVLFVRIRVLFVCVWLGFVLFVCGSWVRMRNKWKDGSVLMWIACWIFNCSWCSYNVHHFFWVFCGLILEFGFLVKLGFVKKLWLPIIADSDTWTVFK